MNVVIIDDCKEQVEDSKRVLFDIYGDVRFHTYSNLSDGLIYLKNFYNYVDLIVLDWDFPRYKGDIPEKNLGEYLLIWMGACNIDIKTIIHSSNEASLKKNYKNVIGYINYDSLGILYDQYFDILSNNEFTNNKKKVLI